VLVSGLVILAILVTPALINLFSVTIDVTKNTEYYKSLLILFNHKKTQKPYFY
jgi:hypothetical protein